MYIFPSDCIHCVVFFPAIAYQLRVCQPPPEVANADALMEDTEFEIGRMFIFSFVFTNPNSPHLEGKN